MTRSRQFWRGHSRFALAFIVLALAVRAILPVGYMVGTGTKSLSVYVCTGVDGTGKMETINLGSSKPASEHDGEKQGACAFSGLAGVADLPQAAEIRLFAPTEHRLQHPIRFLSPGRGLAAPPPPATGPPYLS